MIETTMRIPETRKNTNVKTQAAINIATADIKNTSAKAPATINGIAIRIP